MIYFGVVGFLYIPRCPSSLRTQYPSLTKMLLSRNANDGIAKIISFSPVGNNARQPTCEDDTRGVKVDQMAPLFMLPPLYNGYTNYTCPPNEEGNVDSLYCEFVALYLPSS